MIGVGDLSCPSVERSCNAPGKVGTMAQFCQWLGRTGTFIIIRERWLAVKGKFIAKEQHLFLRVQPHFPYPQPDMTQFAYIIQVRAVQMSPPTLAMDLQPLKDLMGARQRFQPGPAADSQDGYQCPACLGKAEMLRPLVDDSLNCFLSRFLIGVLRGKRRVFAHVLCEFSTLPSRRLDTVLPIHTLYLASVDGSTSSGRFVSLNVPGQFSKWPQLVPAGMVTDDDL